MSLETSSYFTPSKNYFPPSLVPVQVRCEQCFGFRCLAYKDAEDIWRDFKTDAPLIGKVEPVEYLFETPEEDEAS